MRLSGKIGYIVGAICGTTLLLGTVVWAQASASRSTPEGALQELKKALEAAEWKVVAEMLAHPKEPKPLVPPGLIDAWLRAQSASVQLELALREWAEKSGASNPQAASQHPFSPYLNVPSDYTLQILDVEPPGQSARVRARVKCSHRGRGEEETVSVVRLGNNWYVTPPTLLRQLFQGAEDAALAERRTQGLNKLADLLAETAQLLRSGQLKDRAAVLEHLLRRFHQEQIADLLR
ncbi:MAG: hypothetical protein NZM42_14240 [Gemmatales bacterium]|nr:hypothetical protein [Gemmatales bacterium]MDW8224081.1 hypothetical protein [Gemmatales bacterium]